MNHRERERGSGRKEMWRDDREEDGMFNARIVSKFIHLTELMCFETTRII